MASIMCKDLPCLKPFFRWKAANEQISEHKKRSEYFKSAQSTFQNSAQSSTIENCAQFSLKKLWVEIGVLKSQKITISQKASYKILFSFGSFKNSGVLFMLEVLESQVLFILEVLKIQVLFVLEVLEIQVLLYCHKSDLNVNTFIWNAFLGFGFNCELSHYS